MDHSPAFRLRRFMNWFPLGLTYAAMYMGRYNFNIVKADIGRTYHLDIAQMGLIATLGFWTYGLSVALTGPLADRIGGRKAILYGAMGAAVLNLAVGLMFLGGYTAKLMVSLSLLWSLNMFFQSLGALSVVKVNSTWFHVKDRGVFGGIFGIMISSGYLLAVSAGAFILSRLPWYWIFLIPSAAMTLMFAVDLYLVRNRPSHAGYSDFDTGDGSRAQDAEDAPMPFGDLMRTVFHNPIIVSLIFAEFCTGFVRQGVMLYFTEYLGALYDLSNKAALFRWIGASFMFGGIFGGLLCGWMSDKVFQSRRPPVAFLFYLVQVVMLVLLGLSLGRGTHAGQIWAVILLGLTAMFIFGVHGMLTGTASMDFGGRKAAATVAGALDGIQYIGSGLTGIGLGWILKTFGWDGTLVSPLPHWAEQIFVRCHWSIAVADPQSFHPHNAWVWVGAIIPFSLIGAFIMTRLWNAKPGGSH